MPFSAPHTSSAQAHLGSHRSSQHRDDVVLQSRETGDVLSETKQPHEEKVDSKPKAKPFAHFVAGGYGRVHLFFEELYMLTSAQNRWYDLRDAHIAS